MTKRERAAINKMAQGVGILNPEDTRDPLELLRLALYCAGKGGYIRGFRERDARAQQEAERAQRSEAK